jgi:uncharacterized surface protein with fasciclin (FAS1) repeats
MNDRFFVFARKKWICFSLAMICGGFTACTEDYDLDDPGNYPSWLGGSIYEALKNPSSIQESDKVILSGTFSNYLRLIDDLGYAETLSKTGSKTVFPANDDAFERFYSNNQWGVRRYEDLTLAMKKQLLNASMLDNALLVEMLSNISGTSEDPIIQGMALKHVTSASVIDTITHMKAKDDMPVNNDYWSKFYDKGLYVVMDATRPMMVHFTEEQMTTNSITTRGTDSDFEVVTGTTYNPDEHSAYIFRNKIISADITCKNGYIHQMEDVLVPPGNMAQVIRNNKESSLFSRMLDRFSAPYYDYEASVLTRNYNDYVQSLGGNTELQHIDSIYQMRFISSYSQGSSLMMDPNDIEVEYGLIYDPGWNNYDDGSGDNSSRDIAAMFVPTDSALAHFFIEGEGKFLMEEFGKKEGGVVMNDRAHLAENIDSIPLQNVQQLINNLMKRSFVSTVPSKFSHVMDEANDPMGLSLSVLNRTADNKYNVKIANNGVIYMLDKMFAPPSLVAVSAPVTMKSNMRIMNVAVNDGKGTKPLGLNLNYYAYLLAMSATYAFFIPTDDAFERFYVDPSSLADDEPRALKFYYQSKSPFVYCSSWKCLKNDRGEWEVSDSIGRVTASSFRSQFTDLLNYHTIVLGDGEILGDNGNKYYKTKHGGEIMFENGIVKSGAQIEGSVPVSNITQTYYQKNGVAYAIDHVIQAPQHSVLYVLEQDTATTARFSEFLKLCNDFDMDELMAFASDRLSEKNEVTKKQRMAAYHPFAAKNGLTDNVNYFNSYNYTVYAPDNEAMKKAYELGLPKWSDIKAIYEPYRERFELEKADNRISPEVQAARDKALVMVEEINNFIRYHFQDNSVYADNVIDAGVYSTACSDSLGIRQRLTVDGGKGLLYVTDKSGQTITIDANNSTRYVNVMTRDYELNKRQHVINNSSFAVVHQISTPLNFHGAGSEARYDGLWTGSDAKTRMANYRKLFDAKYYKRYDYDLEH